MTTPLDDLTDAIWDAIDNWPALTALGLTKFKLDGATPSRDDFAPGSDELPSLTVLPFQGKPEWFLNQAQQVGIRYQIVAYTAGFNLAAGNAILWEVYKALHQCAPEGEQPYIEQATGNVPQDCNFSWRPGRVGTGEGVQALASILTITLSPILNPLQSDS